MKRLAVALVLVAGVTAVTFASFNVIKKKPASEKKAIKKVKKECRHTCPYSQV